MPKNTFFNLNKNKIDNIINAAVKEFSRVPFDKASINNIVSDANIPRGSFYQYFENKEDLYEYVIRSICISKGNTLKSLLEKNGGDIFKSFESLFIQEFQFFKDKNYHDLFKNFFAHSRQSMQEKISNKILMDDMNKKHQEIIKMVNMRLYNLTEENIFTLLHLLFTSMRNVFIKADRKNLTEEEALNTYKNILNIFKYGVLKTND
ncbi:TetR/AcrR family transcriptional regulator [Clostridium aestuarii]|uniref:TetR/AcrR family transcriptional regulator n=1 Tax=Clostridium aestuarii TaxID=338193 RepID=A0ABT4CY95_9CLOT|nr:TetR/AcrR family transcriptional regulator [Clostridium aestuarii]MCY6482920.1 TetR/AcrR family transcriptional regulator [Clostridium aestuarii]